jgi:hypothetical protein
VIMRAGDCALGSLIASPLFLPVLFWQYARPLPLLAQEATKKAQSHACWHEHGPIVRSVANSQVRSQVPAEDAAYCMSRTIIPCLLAYTSLRTLSTFFQHCIWHFIALVFYVGMRSQQYGIMIHIFVALLL